MYERVNGSKRLATALANAGMDKIYTLSKALTYDRLQLIEDIDALYRVVYGYPDPEPKQKTPDDSDILPDENDLLF